MRAEGLIICLIAGVIAALIANNKGRSPVAWFFLGFFFPIIAIIVVSCIENLKEAEARRRHDYERLHRQREQLRQEQLKNDARHGHAGARLDAHDRALGMNTRDAVPLEAGEAAAVLAPGTPPPVPISWHYAVGNQQRGPVDEPTLRDLLRRGDLAPTTLVWTDGMPEWQPARDIPELA
jgi:hypothetical protein